MLRAKESQEAKKHFCVDAFRSPQLHTVDVGVETVCFAFHLRISPRFTEAVQYVILRKAGPTGGGDGFSLPLFFVLFGCMEFLCMLLADRSV